MSLSRRTPSKINRIPLALLSILLIIFSVNLKAQQVIPDTTTAVEEAYFESPIDSVNDQTDYIPPDVIFIPSDVLYDRAWDNANVRQKRQDLSQMEDTTALFLSNPSETPFHYPFPGKLLSPFGYRGRHFHAGVDIKLNLGDSVICAFDGKVRLAKRYRGYGNLVVVRHYNGLETVYAHLSKILVAVNQDVKAGEVLGLGGRTGRATANHLHFETRYLGEPFNPVTLLDLDSHLLKKDTVLIYGSLFNYGAKPKKGLRSKSHKTVTESTVTPVKKKKKSKAATKRRRKSRRK